MLQRTKMKHQRKKKKKKKNKKETEKQNHTLDGLKERPNRKRTEMPRARGANRP